MLRRLVAVVLTAPLLAAVAPRAAAADEPVRAVQALVDRRAAAERTHDRTAFAATIDPKAPAAFRDAQLKGFDNLASLPIESLEYQVRTDVFGDLSHAVNRAEYANARVALPETVRQLRFTLDAGRPGLDEMWWTYVQRDGKWYVAGDDDVTDVGLESTKSMWDLGPVVAVTSAHVMLLAHPEDKDRASALLGLTEAALGTVAQRWTLPWAGHLVGFLPHSPDELVTLIQATVDVTKFIAFVSYSFDPDTFRTSAPRLYVQDTNLSKYTPEGQTETLVHEFTHAAAAGVTAIVTPRGCRRARPNGSRAAPARTTRGAPARATTRRATTTSGRAHRPRYCVPTTTPCRSSPSWRASSARMLPSGSSNSSRRTTCGRATTNI